MTRRIKIISPIDQSIVAERDLASPSEIEETLINARRSQHQWAALPLPERASICHRAVDYMLENKSEIGAEITRQMGRPISQTPGELDGMAERARYMIEIAEAQLADIEIEEKAGFSRFIRRDPVGVVLVLAPWNYPYLTAVNAIIPALMAGNSVILKHSAQTLLCGERFAEAFLAAEMPEGVFSTLHLDHADTAAAVADDRIGFVSFTGSVAGGRAIEQAVAMHFKGLALELGGKDPAYVRADADIKQAAVQISDGAFFNAGQSCCGVERVYVAESAFDELVREMVAETKCLRPGNPLDIDTNLGPLVSVESADFVRRQTAEAIASGARAWIDHQEYSQNLSTGAYLPPQILTAVDHSMRVMSEESFGPVVGVMPVAGDEEALALMNDSDYGLTASIWTRDEQQAISIGNQLETGTVFMNRCDYLDPALAWVGRKQSGKGCALSELGYHQLTQPKSFHLKISGV